MSGKMTEMRREDVLERWLLVDFGRMVAGDVGRLAPEGMCWWSGGGVGLCKEVGQEGVGRLAPERNELSC